VCGLRRPIKTATQPVVRRTSGGIVSAILEPNAIKSILTYLKLPDKPPELALAIVPMR